MRRLCDCASALAPSAEIGVAAKLLGLTRGIIDCAHVLTAPVSLAMQATERAAKNCNEMAAFLSRCLRSRCSPPTAPIAPPLQHTCPAQPITIQQHPRTRRARHIAHDGPRPTHHLPRTLTTLGMLFSGLTGRYVLRAGPSSRRLWIPPLRAARAGAGFAGVRIAFGVRIRVGARLGPS